MAELCFSLNESLTIQIKNEKLAPGRTEYIENKWTYKLTGDPKYKENDFNFELLKTFVSKSSIVTFYSRNNTTSDSLVHVTIKSLYFDWALVDDQIFVESDSVIFKFIMLAIMQIIDFFTKGFDSGRLHPNSNNSKIVILDKRRTNIFTQSDDMNTINCLKRISFFPSLSNPNMTLFKKMLNSNEKKFYTSQDIVSTVTSVQDYLKTIYIKVVYGNLNFQKRLAIDTPYFMSKSCYNETYVNEIFLYNSLSHNEFDILSFKGARITKWVIPNINLCIELVHDTITGERFIYLNSTPLAGSYGISGRHLFSDYPDEMNSNFEGDKLWFQFDHNITGYVEIRRIYLTDLSFFNNLDFVLYRYSCIVNKELLHHVTQEIILNYSNHIWHNDQVSIQACEKKHLEDFQRKKKYFNNCILNNRKFEYFPDWPI